VSFDSEWKFNAVKSRQCCHCIMSEEVTIAESRHSVFNYLQLYTTPMKNLPNLMPRNPTTSRRRRTRFKRP
jgi:hypothetical protein